MAELITGRQNSFANVGDGIAYDIINDRSAGAIAFNKLIKDMTKQVASQRIKNMNVVRESLIQISKM